MPRQSPKRLPAPARSAPAAEASPAAAEESGRPAAAANFLLGAWRASGSGEVARMNAARPAARVRLWPRSSAADVEEALAAAAEAAPAWLRRSRARRLAVLGSLALPRGAAALADAEVESLLGLRPRERPASELRGRVRYPRPLVAALAGKEPDAEAAAVGRGTALVVAHACELAVGPARRALAHLAAGRAVVLLADVAFPWAGDLLARAAEGSGLPAGALAVVHGDARRLAGALLPELGRDDRGVACVDLAAFPEDLSEPHRRLGSGPPGLWRPLAARSRVVGRSADVAAAAGGALRNAFGRSGTLFGQVPGQVVRVLCHERRFSAFTEALLERAVELADPARAVPRLLEDGVEHARRAWALGLDEGATPVLDARETPPGPPGADPRRLVGPVIFTNVEPVHRLAGGARPVPVLSLIRASSDAEARRWAARLDRVELPASHDQKGPP